MKHIFIAFTCSILLTSSLYAQGALSPKRVAILAFKNLSGDAALDYIGSGFGETLTTKLANVKELELYERMQILKLLEEQKLQISGYVEPDKAVEVGKMLGVQFTVIGSFMKVGDNLKADTRLVNVETGKIDAASDVKGKYGDIFTLMEQLALKLAQNLNAPVTPEEKTQIARKPAGNVSAYEWFAKGMSFYESSKYDDALHAFEKAIEMDKKFAEAFTKAGDVYFYAKGDDTKAADYYIKACKIYEEQQNWKLADLSCLEAILAYEEKAKKADEGNGTETAIKVYHDIAGKVLELYEKKIYFSGKSGDKDSAAGYMIHESEIYSEILGDTQKAIQKAEEAVKIYEQTGNSKLLQRAKDRLKKLKVEK